MIILDRLALRYPKRLRLLNVLDDDVEDEEVAIL